MRAAYHRAAYMEDRAKLMQCWADDLDGRGGGKVVKIGLATSASSLPASCWSTPRLCVMNTYLWLIPDLTSAAR